MKVQKSKSASVFLLMSLAGASAATDLDTAGIDSITGLKGKLNSDDQPKVYFMHIGGEGSTDKLARGVRAAFDAIKQVRSANPELAQSFSANPLPAQSSLDPSLLQKILAVKGETKDGMFKAVFGRTVKMPCGCTAGKEMGVNTWAAFAGANDNALVDDDFVVLENELQAVLKSLCKSGINIVAIHHHMIGEQPRTIFLHYWGCGPAADLAEAVKRALGNTKK